MTDLILTCDHCGNQMRVTEYAMGSWGRCRKCRQQLQVKASNTRVREDERFDAPLSSVNDEEDERVRTRAAAEAAAPAERAADGEGETCTRCGKPFRGDWEKTEMPDGVWCDRCARLTGVGLEHGHQTAPRGSVRGEAPVPQREAPESMLRYDAPQEEPEDETDGLPEFAKKNPQLFRGLVLGAAVLILGACVFFMLFPEFTEVPGELEPRPYEDVEGPMLHMPQWLVITLSIVFYGGLSFVAQGFAIYCIMWFAGRLDKKASIISNVAELLPTIVVVTVASYFPLVGTLMAWLVLWWREDLPLFYTFSYIFVHPMAAYIVYTLARILLGLVGLALYG